MLQEVLTTDIWLSNTPAVRILGVWKYPMTDAWCWYIC